MLAETLVDILQVNGLFEAMAEAGKRIDRQEQYNHEYQKLFDEFMKYPESEMKRNAVEEAEASSVPLKTTTPSRTRGSNKPNT
eukprot:10298479-Lingulodinium_polyedra.AAC.1